MVDNDIEALDMLCDRLQLALASVKAASTLRCPDAIDAKISAPSDATNEAMACGPPDIPKLVPKC